MGLFSLEKEKKLPPPNPWERVDLPAPTDTRGLDVAAEQLATRFWRQSEDTLKLVETKQIEPYFLQPDYDLSMFCFDNKEYLCEGSVTFNTDTGEIVQDSRMFLADNKATSEFVLDLDDLESSLDGVRLELKSLPVLRTKTSLFNSDGEAVAELNNRVSMVLKPYTKTGRLAKYPVEIHFSAHEYVDVGGYCPEIIGSNGTVSYLRNGHIGKAWASYHLLDSSFVVKWKQDDDWFYVDSIDYRKRGDIDSVRVYQR